MIPPSGDTFAAAACLLAAYCRSLDTRDPDTLRSLFTIDAELVLADRTVSGVDAIVASYEAFFASPRVSRHHVTNIEVASVTETELDVRAYLVAVSERAGNVSLASGTYHDHLVRSGPDWRIRRQRISLEVPFTRVASAPAPT
jgi:hypothetical protein